MGVSIAPAEAGQVTVCLPAEVAELFLLDLEQRGQEWQEAMRKARILEMRRAAELDTASGASLRAFQATQDGWAEEYQTLRTNGKGHREALNIIPGPKERDAITVTDVELGIQAAMGRRGRRRREARNADIIRLAGEGRSRQAIADALGVRYQIVLAVLKKAGVTVRDARHDRRGAMGAIEPRSRAEGGLPAGGEGRVRRGVDHGQH
jgi:hypothetical protein